MKKSIKKHRSLISRHGRKCPNQVREYSDTIPVDLLMDIFSRVSAKSIARFRCVSKFWASVLRRHDFTELFLTMSSTRPRLLFTIRVENELFIFSCPRPQELAENSSLVATRCKYSHKYFPTNISPPVQGLFCLWNSAGRAEVICNPVTGESITLPEVEARDCGSSLFGYDPTNRQYKVLFVSRNRHWVLSLEYGKRCLWRKIDDPIFHYYIYAFDHEICINGVLYYRAADSEGSSGVVCFDLRSEKFSFVNFDQDMSYVQRYGTTLFNYKGKLGTSSRRGNEVVLWVLEDAMTHKWSKTICVLRDKIVYEKNSIAGITGTGDIVFSPCSLSNPFYVCFYNIERKTFTRVNIHGFEDLMDILKAKFKFIIFWNCNDVHTSIDYVENLKYM